MSSPLAKLPPVRAADDPGVWQEIAQFFTPAEFRDPDNMDANFLRLLAKARRVADCPFRIISDHRTPKHNGDVGGAGHSAHMELPCACVDLQLLSNVERFKVLTGVLAVGFTRVGIYPGNIDGSGGLHVDASRVNPSPRVWTQFTPG